jgi:hypothetical protein
MHLPDFTSRIVNDGLRSGFSGDVDSRVALSLPRGKRALLEHLRHAIDQNVNGVAEKHDKQGVSGLFRL